MFIKWAFHNTVEHKSLNNRLSSVKEFQIGIGNELKAVGISNIWKYGDDDFSSKRALSHLY